MFFDRSLKTRQNIGSEVQSILIINIVIAWDYDNNIKSDGFRYSTYKVALWKIATSITGFGQSTPYASIIAKLQNTKTGGVYTFYSKNFYPDGQTNVETTSVAIMANTVGQ